MASSIEKDYNEVKSDSFDESQWNLKGRNINLHIYNFHDLDSYLFNAINKFKEIKSPQLHEILLNEPLLIQNSEKTQNYIMAILEKTKYFRVDLEIENEVKKKNDEFFLIPTMSIQEIRENRRREIENLSKAAKELKDNMEYLGLKPTDEQQKTFDEIEKLNVQNVNNNLENPKEIDKKETNLKETKKKKCIIF